MLGWCWSTVYDAGPTSSQHWVIASCLMDYHKGNTNVSALKLREGIRMRGDKFSLTQLGTHAVSQQTRNIHSATLAQQCTSIGWTSRVCRSVAVGCVVSPKLCADWASGFQRADKAADNASLSQKPNIADFLPGEHGTLARCWFKVGPASQTIGHHKFNIGI